MVHGIRGQAMDAEKDGQIPARNLRLRFVGGRWLRIGEFERLSRQHRARPRLGFVMDQAS